MQWANSVQWWKVRASSWVLASLFLGCSPRVVPSTPNENSTHSESLAEQGELFASRGQSSRAEQYYLAALTAGGDRDAIYPLLIETCIAAGRLGSAARHVDERLEDRPDDPRLLRLSISLSEALGQDDLATRRAERLVKVAGRSAEDDLFLGSFFERRQHDERARRHYAFCLERAALPEQKHRARVALERLATSGENDALALDLQPQEAGRHD